MARLLFARRAQGPIIEAIQTRLTSRGFDTKGVDGDYGGNTVKAVTAFQKSEGLPQTGEVDDATWAALMQQPIPDIAERSLGITATFEGHNFTLAEGNFDGAGITWGIIGFTLKHGELTKIVDLAFKADEALVRDSFGDLTDELLQRLHEPWTKQKAWATALTIGKKTLAEPWRTRWARFGATALAQRLQRQIARDDYYLPSTKTAAKYGLATELGAALCFDIHVQNGGIKQSVATAIKAKLNAAKTERERREIIAKGVADGSNPEWRKVVRDRKMTLATGTGTVYGTEYVLRNWGLDEFAIP